MSNYDMETYNQICSVIFDFDSSYNRKILNRNGKEWDEEFIPSFTIDELYRMKPSSYAQAWKLLQRHTQKRFPLLAEEDGQYSDTPYAFSLSFLTPHCRSTVRTEQGQSEPRPPFLRGDIYSVSEAS